MSIEIIMYLGHNSTGPARGMWHDIDQWYSSCDQVHYSSISSLRFHSLYNDYFTVQVTAVPYTQYATVSMYTVYSRLCTSLSRELTLHRRLSNMGSNFCRQFLTFEIKIYKYRILFNSVIRHLQIKVKAYATIQIAYFTI